MAIAIPIICAFAGSAMAGTAYAAVGWAVGMAVGTLIEEELMKKSATSNSLTDLTIQTSDWGTGIPKIYGSQKVAGNIIWSTDKRKTGGTNGKKGGKGGGHTKKTGKQAYYECGIALMLCEGTVAGIKRIWAGGTLIFDQGNPVFVQDMAYAGAPGGSYVLGSTNGAITSYGQSALGDWTLYHGTGQQDPDPTIVANGGATLGGVPYTQVTLQNGFEYTYGAPLFGGLGTACAYRGLAYIVFPNLNIGYGGVIPPLTFEVISESAGANAPTALTPVYQPVPMAVPFVASGSNQPYLCTGAALYDPDTLVFAGGNAVAYCSVSTGQLKSFSIPQSAVVSENGLPIETGSAGISGVFWGPDDQLWGSGAATGPLNGALATASSGATGAAGSTFQLNGFLYALDNGYSTYTNLSVPGAVYFVDPATGAQDSYPQMTRPQFLGAAALLNFNLFQSGFCVFNGLVYVPTETPGEIAVISSSATGDLTAAVCAAEGVLPGCSVFSDGTYLCISNSANNAIERFSSNTDGTLTHVSTTVVAHSFTSCRLFFAAGYVYIIGEGVLVKINQDGSTRYSSQCSLAGAVTSVLLSGAGITLVQFSGGNNSTPSYQTFNYGDEAITPANVTLASAIEDICTQAGLPNVDTSMLDTSLSVNFSRRATTPARSALKTLGQVYMFDTVDSAGTLKFVPYGQPISAVLGVNDIGYADTVGSGVNLGAPYMLSRAQGSDLPRRVTLKYQSVAANYGTIQQQYEINGFDWGRDATVNIPLTLDDKTASDAVQMMCAQPHIEKNSYAWTTSFAWIHLEPGDVVQMPFGVTRITSITIKNGETAPILQFTGVIDACYVMANGVGDASGVTLPGLGVAVPAAQALQTGSVGVFALNSRVSSVAAPIPQKPVISPGIAGAGYVETPPLDSSDTSPHFSIAAYSSGDIFLGAEVFSSTDGGTTYGSLATIENPGFVGVVQDALPATQAYTWDDSTVLYVYPQNASAMAMASATDIQVMNGANIAMVGSEMIQFGNSEQTTDTHNLVCFKLTHLLRGRRGTEWAMASHKMSEQFTLINDPAIDEQPYALHQINAKILYKVGTAGQDASVVNSTPFTLTGVWYRPWAPANPTIEADGSRNLTLGFQPRARLNGVLTSGVAPTMDPDTQTFSIDIQNASGKIVRTINGALAAPSIQYTAAQQIADGFAAGQPGITFVIYQIGQLGRGYPTAITT